MHIPDAALAPAVWVPLAAVSAVAVGVASAKAHEQLEERQIPVAGVLGAFVFAAQMLNFPITPGTSGHLVGTALLTALVGPWLAILVMSAVLVTQCFVFHDGGLTALGANIFNMALLGAGTTALVLRVTRGVLGETKGRLVGGALGGWLSVFLGAVAATLELVISGTTPLWPVLIPMGGFHALIGLVEGAITVAALSYILAVRPDVARAFAPRQ
jgi:cobalt/nickel transport system permease protein